MNVIVKIFPYSTPSWTKFYKKGKNTVHFVMYHCRNFLHYTWLEIAWSGVQFFIIFKLIPFVRFSRTHRYSPWFNYLLRLWKWLVTNSAQNLPPVYPFFAISWSYGLGGCFLVFVFYKSVAFALTFKLGLICIG